MISDTNSLGNAVLGNYIGLDALGLNAIPNGVTGIGIWGDASSNIVGGTVTAAGNVISGNSQDGLIMVDSNTVGNSVLGNYIGLNAAGSAAVPNGSGGIGIWGRSGGHTIGGTVAGARNVISGNGGSGIFIGETNLSACVIQGNYIGTDATTGDRSEFTADAFPNNGPPQFVGPATRNANGFSIALLLQTNVTYHVQATTNLASPIVWSNLPSFVPSVSPFQFTEPAATNLPRRFYRVSSP